jgi:Trk K+ transport system NAD-binding subunit
MMGLGLAQQLLDLGHTVAIVDVDPLACRFAREKIGVMAFEGSAVSTKVLLEAGIRQANLHYSPTGKNLIVRTSQKTDCFSARSLDELLAKAFEDFPKSS